MEPTTPSGLPSDIAPSAAAASGATRFEFDEAQNGVFADLARNMSFVGMIYLVLGGIVALAALVTLMAGDVAKGVGPLLQAAFFIPIGLWTRRAAQATSAVATTRGNDIGHLMAAMEELKRVYGLQRGLLLVLLGLFALLIVIGFVAGMTGAVDS